MSIHISDPVFVLFLYCFLTDAPSHTTKPVQYQKSVEEEEEDERKREEEEVRQQQQEDEEAWEDGVWNILEGWSYTDLALLVLAIAFGLLVYLQGRL